MTKSTQLPKVGLIGLGNMGRHHARLLAASKHCELFCVCDLNLQKAQECASVYNIPVVTQNPSELFSQVDMVFIAASTHMHLPFIQEALAQSRGVFVEKPLCLSLNEANEIKKIAKQQKKVIFVGHLLQYHNAFNELKKNLNLGKIGKLKIIKSNRLNFGSIRDSESVLYDLTSHDISMVLSIIKELPKKVEINAVFKYSKKIADCINVILYFHKDVIAILNSDWISPYKEHRFSVFGSNGSLIFDDLRDWPEKLIFNPSSINFDKKITQKPLTAIHVTKHEPLKQEIEAFLNCVANKQTPTTDIEEALNVQIVLSMIEEKLKEKYF